MTKKNIFLSVLILLLVGLFLYVNRGWFTSEPLEITHRTGPPMRFARFNRQSPNNSSKGTLPLFFEFNRKLKLTSVKVFHAAEIETNKFAHTLWELVPIYQPVETRGFSYGSEIPRMKPTVPGAVAEPLEPGVKYRLVIEAGSLKAEHDFTAEAAPPVK